MNYITARKKQEKPDDQNMLQYYMYEMSHRIFRVLGNYNNEIVSKPNNRSKQSFSKLTSDFDKVDKFNGINCKNHEETGNAGFYLKLRLKHIKSL